MAGAMLGSRICWFLERLTSQGTYSLMKETQFISEFQNSIASALVGLYIKEGYLMGHHKNTEQ